MNVAIVYFQKFIKVFKQPYPYYIPFSRSFKLLLFLSAIIPAFLLIFQPFNINLWECKYKTLLLAGLFFPIYITLAFNFYALSKIIPRFFNEENWTIGSEIIWSAWNFIMIVLTTSIYWTIIPVCNVSSIHWGQQFMMAFLIGIFPGSSCIYFNYSQAQKRKLSKANILNNFLQSKVVFYEEGILTLSDENESEKVKVSTQDLLFIQAQDNYSKIVWIQNSKLNSVLLRSTLKNIEKQIPYPFITRCYRSFIVNLARISKVQGNAREYKLLLDGYDDTIPVSRESYKKIFRLFDDFTPGFKNSRGTAYKAG
jgi:LytTr DNA-binding domain